MKPRRKRYTITEKLKVIYRKTNDGEVIAFMPELPANYGKIVCYAHIGQHSEATLEYYQSTRSAKPAEYIALHTELKSIYNDVELDVKRRMYYTDLTDNWRDNK